MKNIYGNSDSYVNEWRVFRLDYVDKSRRRIKGVHSGDVIYMHCIHL